MSLPLSNKAFVIVGGTTGLGQSAALACVAAGAKVVVIGRKQESIETISPQLDTAGFALRGDATQEGVAEQAIQKCVEQFGRFDGLYHVAGGSGRRHGDGPLHELTPEGWRYTLELNLTSVFLSNRAAVRYFLSKGQAGSVLNCGSVLGFSPSPKFFTTHAYATAKAGLIGLTQASAAAYASNSVRFNVLAPALVETPMSLRAQQDPAIQQFMKSKQPLDGGRMGVPEDLDAAVVWLLSDQSRFVTGQVIAIDGGWTVSEGQIPVA
jgi:NAD(P)-dependent dehydrogenase (short-subunit alcohol dehydrogenase family)